MNVWLSSNLLIAQSAQPVDEWSRTFFGLDPTKRFTLFVIVIGCMTGVICTLIWAICGTINSIHRRRAEADMKREMIDRGMSADEIASVIEAATPEDAAQRWIASWAKSKRRT